MNVRGQRKTRPWHRKEGALLALMRMLQARTSAPPESRRRWKISSASSILPQLQAQVLTLRHVLSRIAHGNCHAIGTRQREGNGVEVHIEDEEGPVIPQFE